MADCIFCKIIDGTIPSTVIMQNEHVIAIQDIMPKAPVHYLIIPKKHSSDLRDMDVHDGMQMQAMIAMIQDLAATLPGNQAFNVISNNGREAGQSVFHTHWHFLAGRDLWHGNL